MEWERIFENSSSSKAIRAKRKRNTENSTVIIIIHLKWK
jgi:hypothetical protein